MCREKKIIINIVIAIKNSHSHHMQSHEHKSKSHDCHMIQESQ